MLQINCPQCRSLLAFEDGWAGRVVACPDCAAQVRLPAPQDEGMRAGAAPDRPTWQDDDDEPIELDIADRAISRDDALVLAEIDRLQEQKTGWGSALGLLAVSLIFYLGAVGVQQIWESVFILIPVLIFHELGHYVAMRIFGYRNLRMFFIPFFGAAVSGRHYNVAGWQKAIVALAGPLPGVLVGSIAAAVALGMGTPKYVADAASLMLFLNGFNLLPFLPLDGGWVVHAVLFVRNPVIDIVFRVIAALCLAGIALLTQSWCLGSLAFFMLLAAPTAYRTARIAQRLGQEGLVTRSVDGQSIPPAASLRILAELRSALPANTPPATLAQQVATVFETFNAEPPGLPASVGLLMLHAAGFLLALIMAVAIAVVQHPPG